MTIYSSKIKKGILIIKCSFIIPFFGGEGGLHFCGWHNLYRTHRLDEDLFESFLKNNQTVFYEDYFFALKREMTTVAIKR